MGLANAEVLAVTMKRYDDFPEPLVVRERYTRLWLRQDIDAFLNRHPRMGRKRNGESDESGAP